MAHRLLGTRGVGGTLVIPKSTLALEDSQVLMACGTHAHILLTRTGPQVLLRCREPEMQALPEKQHLTSVLPLGRSLEEGTPLPQHLGTWGPVSST